MTDYSTATLAAAIERALMQAAPDLQRALPANFPIRTFANRSVRALLVEFSSFDHCLSFAGAADTASQPQQVAAALPVHDPETGELADAMPPVPEPEYDGPEADEPASARQPEMVVQEDHDESPPPVDDVGKTRVEAFANYIEKMFSGPSDVWREMSRGVPDEQVPQMVRQGNAILIDSAQHHHPELFKRIKATLDRGRVTA